MVFLVLAQAISVILARKGHDCNRSFPPEVDKLYQFVWQIKKQMIKYKIWSQKNKALSICTFHII